MGTQRRGAKHSSQENGEDTGYSSTKIVRGNPIIINGPDYLLRISETRMEAFLILYRRFTEKEIRDLLQENGIVDFKKHFSLVTPKDFYTARNMRVVFEGELSQLVFGRPDSFSERIRGGSMCV